MEKKVKKVKKVRKVNKANKIHYQTSEQQDIKSLLILIVVVLLCVGGIWLVTKAFVTKDLFKKEEVKEEEVIPGEINYSVATVGTILNRPYDQYYVVVYDQTGDYAVDMATMVNEYAKDKKSLHVYTVDLSNAMNKEYYDAENVNLNVTNVSEFKFGDITLLKVKGGKVLKTFTDLEKMKAELGVTK